MYFRSYRMWKYWLEHSLKIAVSENALTVNMWKCHKYLWNFHESAFLMCFHHFEKSWFGISLPYYYVKSYACFLTHCVPTASIPLKSERIYNSQYKCNYLKKENLFLNFWFNFWNLHQISNIFKQKMMVTANVFPKLQTVKNFVRPLCKKRACGTLFDTQHVKVSQLFAKSQSERF